MTDQVVICGTECTALLDSGSVISSVSQEFYDNYLSHIEVNSLKDIFPDGITITSATEHKLNIAGYIDVNVLLPGLLTPVPILVTVLKSSILSSDMPALLGSNALEVWKQELQTKHQHSMPSINPVIYTWKCEKKDSGFIVNTKYTPLTSHNCSFVSAKVKIDDVRPYSRQLLFTPFDKYASCLSSCTISVPGNSTCVDCDITTLPHKSAPNSKTVRLLANKRLGRVTPMSEEVFIPIVAPVKQQSYDDSTDKQQFFKLIQQRFMANR